MKLIDNTFQIAKRIMMDSKKPLLSSDDEANRIVLSQGEIPYAYMIYNFNRNLTNTPIPYPSGPFASAYLYKPRRSINVRASKRFEDAAYPKSFLETQDALLSISQKDNTYRNVDRSLILTLDALNREWDGSTRSGPYGKTYLVQANQFVYDKLKAFYDSLVPHDEYFEFLGDKVLVSSDGVSSDQSISTSLSLRTDIGAYYTGARHRTDFGDASMGWSQNDSYICIYTPFMRRGKFVFSFSNIRVNPAGRRKACLHRLCTFTPCVDFYACSEKGIVTDVQNEVTFVRKGTVRGTPYTPNGFGNQETFSDQEITIETEDASRLYLFIAYFYLTIPLSREFIDKLTYYHYTEPVTHKTEYVYHEGMITPVTPSELEASNGIIHQMSVNGFVNIVYAGPASEEAK